jgi:hypothetical protein
VIAVSAIFCPATRAARAGETNRRMETVLPSPPSDVVFIATSSEAGSCCVRGTAGDPCAVVAALPALAREPPSHADSATVSTIARDSDRPIGSWIVRANTWEMIAAPDRDAQGSYSRFKMGVFPEGGNAVQ